MLFLRFRRTDPKPTSFTHASYQTIAQIVNISYNQVQHICRQAVMPAKKATSKKEKSRLTQEHIDYLINPQTIQQWAGRTVKERAILFQRQFQKKRIAVTSLRRLYQKHGIKSKKVRQEKVMPA